MKAFIYDMDGVIADTEPVHMQAEQHVMKKMGVELEVSYFQRYQGMTDIMIFEDLRKQFGVKPAAEKLAKAKAYLFNKILHETHVTPIAGSLELIMSCAGRRGSRRLSRARRATPSSPSSSTTSASAITSTCS